ncbi:MAG: response regulator [Candidatus Omnitrophota bacterium]
MPTEKEQIYVVDDDESICRSLGILLSTYAFTVGTFTSAKDFFDAVADNDSGCLILDIHMPELDGWETLKRIVDSGSKRPVIIMSAEKNDRNRERAMKAGAAGYLRKPFSGEALVDLINIAVEKRR